MNVFKGVLSFDMISRHPLWSTWPQPHTYLGNYISMRVCQ